MKDFPLKAKIECQDGPAGESLTVIVNPITRQVTHFVVRDKTNNDTVKRLVPVDKVASSTPNSIHLACTKGELFQMLPFIRKYYVRKEVPGSSHPTYQLPFVTSHTETVYRPVIEKRIPKDHLALHRGAQVEATDGHVGQLGEFLVDTENCQITHLILLEGHLFGKREITLPVSAIDHVWENRVYLNLNKQAIRSLPAVSFERHYS